MFNIFSCPNGVIFSSSSHNALEPNDAAVKTPTTYLPIQISCVQMYFVWVKVLDLRLFVIRIIWFPPIPTLIPPPGDRQVRQTDGQMGLCLDSKQTRCTENTHSRGAQVREHLCLYSPVASSP